jgi:colicin import membrane protein
LIHPVLRSAADQARHFAAAAAAAARAAETDRQRCQQQVAIVAEIGEAAKCDNEMSKKRAVAEARARRAEAEARHADAEARRKDEAERAADREARAQTGAQLLATQRLAAAAERQLDLVIDASVQLKLGGEELRQERESLRQLTQAVRGLVNNATAAQQKLEELHLDYTAKLQQLERVQALMQQPGPQPFHRPRFRI